MQGIERLKVLFVCELIEISGQSDLILVARVRSVASDIVDLLKTGDRDIVCAIRVHPSVKCRFY